MPMSIIEVTAKIAVSCIPNLNLRLSKGLPRSLLIMLLTGLLATKLSPITGTKMRVSQLFHEELAQLMDMQFRCLCPTITATIPIIPLLSKTSSPNNKSPTAGIQTIILMGFKKWPMLLKKIKEYKLAV